MNENESEKARIDAARVVASGDRSPRLLGTLERYLKIVAGRAQRSARPETGTTRPDHAPD